MTDFLVKRFIKNSTDVNDPAVRTAYGNLAGAVGIFCNVLLCAAKLAVGTLFGSISITADAVNNLSDASSSVITLVGFRLSAKPADDEHPYGHARIEYLAGLAVSVMILVIGVELARSSIGKILSPTAVEFSLVTVAVLLLSIGVKLWMAWFNARLGRRIDSAVMIATAKDSRSDVIATGATILALLLSLVTDLPVDGVMGVAVSLFILKTAYDIIRDTVGELLGRPASPEVTQKLREMVLESPQILGLHDLMIHDYGPLNMIGSCHVEVRSDADLVEVHEVVDTIEREIYEKLHILMTIHMDPIEQDNPQVNACRALVGQIIGEMQLGLSFHDFRMVAGDSSCKMIFDVVVPFGCKCKNQQLQDRIVEALRQHGEECQVVITFDRDYTD